MGEVTEGPNGDLTATRPGRRVVLSPPRGSQGDDTATVTSLRRYLDPLDAPANGDSDTAQRWLLVIDHREARVFRSYPNATERELILPHDPQDYFRHAHHSLQFTRGQEKPDPNSFFNPVAAALHSHGPIVVFGTGKGMSSERDQFVAWLHLHHPSIAQRIIASQSVDEHHLSDGQLLAKARALFSFRPEPVI